MPSSEAQARITINKMLENAGWRFLATKDGQSATVLVEPGIIIADEDKDFESVKRGYVDYLLLDERGFPVAVLEAKQEKKNPLDGKEQARKYAHSQKVRFVLLSNGMLHYFWDLEQGDPEIIVEFPTQESLKHREDYKPNNELLANEEVDEGYIALTQDPILETIQDT